MYFLMQALGSNGRLAYSRGLRAVGTHPGFCRVGGVRGWCRTLDEVLEKLSKIKAQAYAVDESNRIVAHTLDGSTPQLISLERKAA